VNGDVENDGDVAWNNLKTLLQPFWVHPTSAGSMTFVPSELPDMSRLARALG
jgi:hypothetical protein